MAPLPPVSAQQADLICYQALLKKGDIRTNGGVHVLILGNSQFHDAVDESQSEAQVCQAVRMRLLLNETTNMGEKKKQLQQMAHIIKAQYTVFVLFFFLVPPSACPLGGLGDETPE